MDQRHFVQRGMILQYLGTKVKVLRPPNLRKPKFWVFKGVVINNTDGRYVKGYVSGFNCEFFMRQIK